MNIILLTALKDERGYFIFNDTIIQPYLSVSTYQAGIENAEQTGTLG